MGWTSGFQQETIYHVRTEMRQSLGFDLGIVCIKRDLTGLKFNEVGKILTNFAISDDFQHLANIRRI